WSPTDAVAERILLQWLQQHGGYPGRLQLGGDISSDCQPTAMPHLLQPEIQLQLPKLFAERQLSRLARLEGEPKQIAEGDHHPLRRLGIGSHQRRYSVQGVEEEVGLQLQRQRVEPRLSKGALH